MTGKEFKSIRERYGYSAREIAKFMQEQGMPNSVARSIYRLEERDDVPLKYVKALERFIGKPLTADQTDTPNDSRAATTPPPARPHSAREAARTKQRPTETDQKDSGPLTEEQFIRFLNTLPMTDSSLEWITAFRESLRQLFSDVDRIVINVNLDCDLANPRQYRTNMAVTEHVLTVSSSVIVSNEAEEKSPSERLIENFRLHGYPLERYHPPFSLDCYVDGVAYIGTLFFWRERQHPPISQRTVQRITALQPFLIFALSYAVLRNRQVHPQDRAFNDALTFLVQSAGLSEQEQRVVTLLLYGHSYDQVSSRLHLSIDTVRKYVMSIYRKTDTHSGGELFAKYFTPRLGF